MLSYYWIIIMTYRQSFWQSLQNSLSLLYMVLVLGVSKPLQTCWLQEKKFRKKSFRLLETRLWKEGCMERPRVLNLFPVNWYGVYMIWLKRLRKLISYQAFMINFSLNGWNNYTVELRLVRRLAMFIPITIIMIQY